jgi:hypothetical protein
MLLAVRRSEHPAGHDILGMFAHDGNGAGRDIRGANIGSGFLERYPLIESDLRPCSDINGLSERPEPVKDLTINPRRQRSGMSAGFYPAEKKYCPLWITTCIPCSRKQFRDGSEKQRDVYLNRGTQEYRRRAAALFKRGYFKIRFAVAA